MDEIREKVLKRQDPIVNEKLKNAKVSILGCGGLGSNIAMTLARSGIGELFLYDYDIVEYSNLNRQNYTLDELGGSKAYLTKKKIESTLPYVKCHSKDIYLTTESMDTIVDKTDIFIEAFDNKESKTMLFDYFVGRKDKLLITGSGVSGLGELSDIKIKQIENVTMIGDFNSNPNDGLYLAYVSLIANLEALVAIKIIKGDYNGK
ncbi:MULTISPECIES: sulfur carrier protein ThiS adenylyltransferase ThiF [Anaerococcus]|uniref:Sulfur carrier protein ThiS adenylyltransferase ThiF n=1 Tax=Anaerococcus nagyae TaxID=1755241 RepID=A0A3E2TKM0_9FIRM|nr:MULTISPECIES: sulfur carrier protein ThiS adenylyltransferase ThiF [Anaerococcus]MBP2068975.1 sulfur carrier protein ThiS adenylyltransferase [Anaerococcus nagyae]MDU1829522.1 sulfur carrier protein ThiS adenylyltransferase ThiF [Anaerococcus sp.]MDU1865319.1 sulfur carrier protein ThiS adenylyltransferase ThiF [Anaerococcus sp.]MDU2353917.1 sulfur carrier protein ThiS adenylyltransferase ThiF [Anaerococcus sp.]MDU2566104.1 sulfur carrier protein ThiS adenylyltransferase ThiF [Anaerococcus 